MYMSVVDVRHIPEQLAEWRGINPRDPNSNSHVSKGIAKSLEESPALFLFKNRGLTILAERVVYDNATNVVELVMNDEEMHGLLDGGHTYQVIRDYVEEIGGDETVPALVKVEMLTGILDLQEAVAIVESRNTSTQVKDQSLEELRGNYQMIKEVISGTPYADRVAYKENELDEQGSRKDIDVKELLSYLVCFDVERYGHDNHPTKSYSSKQAVVDEVRSRKEELKKYTPLLIDILELHDAVYQLLPEAYNKSVGGRFGALTGVQWTENKARMKESELRFISQKSAYRIPDAFIYPVLSAFRYLVEVKDGGAVWKTNPRQMLEGLKGELAKRIGERALEVKHPTKMGKDIATWQSCYDCVRMAYLESVSTKPDSQTHLPIISH